MIIIEQVPSQGNGDLQVENIQPKGMVSNNFEYMSRLKNREVWREFLAFITFKSGSNAL